MVPRATVGVVLLAVLAPTGVVALGRTASIARARARAPLARRASAARGPAWHVRASSAPPAEAPSAAAAPTRPPKGHGVWLPVGSISSLSGLGPVRVEIAQRTLAVWEHAGEWSVVSDACPHRLAPLSQGHVDAATGCLECPYHGWQFDASGGCTRVPQAEDGLKGGVAVTSYPARPLGDILWAFFEGVGGSAALPMAEGTPEALFPALREAPPTLVRDVPYSFDFLVENFMDPAHIPFAHHGLQGLRTDGSPIPMRLVSENASTVELGFDDVVRGKARQGVVSFRAPCYYHFRTFSEVKGWEFGLIILTVPVRPGHSRILITSDRQRFPSWLPTWFLHALSNRFVDTDVWLHDAERWARGTAAQSALGRNAKPAPRQTAEAGAGSAGLRNLPYALPTSSDMGAMQFRSWWARYGLANAGDGFGPAPGAELRWVPRTEQLDRYAYHVHSCAPCRAALSRARALRQWAPAVALVPVALGAPLPLRVAGLLLALALRAGAGWAERMIAGAPDAHELGLRAIED